MSHKRNLSTVVKSTAVLISAAFLSLLIFLPSTASATAGINNSLNYQGRLLTSSGAIAPDGFYNIEFKIYQDGTGCVSSGTSPCGGTLKYTEDWVYGTGSPDNRVKVTNGYFSVQIGTITPFASLIDWNQNTLWMSVNIGNTSTAANFAGASGDGEMLPFKRLTAAPYALNAAALGGLASSAFVQLSANNNFTGTNNITTTTNSTTAFEVQPAGGGTPVLDVDTTNSRVGIGIAAPIYTLDVRGGNGINSAAGYSVNGTAGATTTCASGQYLTGQTVTGGITTGGVCVANKIGVSSVISNTNNNGNTYSVPLVVAPSGLATFSYFNGSIVKQVTCGNYACSANTISTPQQPGHAGQYASMALASDGTPRYANYDTTSGNILVYTVCSTVTCTSGTNTTVATSTAGAFGYTALALASDNTGRIVYVDGSNNLKYAQCGDATCTSGNAIVNTIGVTNGSPVSIKLDPSTGNARILYSNGSGALTYAVCANAGCTSGNVANYTIDTGGTASLGSLALSSGGLPSFAYTLFTGGAYRVRFASCSVANCSGVTPINLDPNSQDSATASIALGGDGLPRVTYADTTNNDLRFAQCFDSTCSNVTLSVIDYVGAVGNYNSIAVGSDGLVRSVYYNGTIGNYKFWAESVNDNSLSSLTAAGAANTIDNLANAQTWNWSTATTQTAMTMSANTLTSGALLALGSSSTALSTALATITASGNNAAVSGNALQVSMTGALSTGTALNVTQAGTGVGLVVTQSGSAGNVLVAGTTANPNALIVNHTGNVGIGRSSTGSALDVVGTINATTGFSYGGLAGSSPACTNGQFLQNQAVGGGIVTGGTCVSLATISNGLFTQSGSTVNGITCTNGQTLVWNTGTWNCGTGSAGAASTTTVSSVIDNLNSGYPSMAVDAAGQSHVTYSGYEATCASSGCGSAAVSMVSNPQSNCIARLMDAAQGPDGFPRLLYGCTNLGSVNGYFRYVVCYNTGCTTSHVTVLDSTNGSQSYGHAAGSMVLGTDGFPRFILAAGSGLRFIQCTNTLCTASTSVYVNSLDTSGVYNFGASIALDSSNNPRITYYASAGTYQTYKFRFLKCGNASCTSSNTISDINTSVYSQYGTPSSAVIMNHDGFPRLAYVQNSGSPNYRDSLISVQCTTAGCSSGNNPATVYTQGTNSYQINDVSMKYVYYNSVSYTDIAFAYSVSNGSSGVAVGIVACSSDPCGNGAVTQSLSAHDSAGVSLAISSTGIATYASGALASSNTLVAIGMCSNTGCSAQTTASAGSISYISYQQTYGAALLLDGNSYPKVFASMYSAPSSSYSDSWIEMDACSSTACGTITNNFVEGVAYSNAGSSSSVAMGSDGLPRIAYTSADVYMIGSNKYINPVVIAECTTSSCNTYNYVNLPLASCSTSTCFPAETSLLGLGPRSLQVDSSGNYRLAYLDSNSNNVKYVQCTAANCSSYTTAVIDTTSATAEQNYSVSLALAGGGSSPLITYSNASNALAYVLCSSASCTSPSPVVLDSTVNSQSPNIAYNPSTGYVYIAYYDNTNFALRYIDCTTTACSGTSPLTLDSGPKVGAYPSVVVAAGGFADISYLDSLNHNIKVATCNNVGCTSSATITISAVGPGYSAIAIDSYGYIRVAYSDTGSACTTYSSSTCTTQVVGQSQMRMWMQVPSGGTVSNYFNALMGAINNNTIDNGAFAQTWQWSALSSGVGLTLNTSTYNNLTTGSLLSVSSSSNVLSGTAGLGNFTASGGAGNSGVALVASMSSAGNTGTALLVNQSSTAAGANALSIITSGTTNSSTGNTSAGLIVTGTGRVGIGLGTNAPGFLLDANGDINSASGLYVGGNQVCVSTGCTSSTTFDGHNLFSKSGNTVSGITCNNGETLSYNYSTAKWGCASGTFMTNSSSIYGAASSTSVYATTSNYFSSQTIDSQGLSHISFGNVVSGTTATIKNVQCLSTGCGNSIVTNALTTCSYSVIDSAVGTDNFGRILFSCGDSVLRYMTCANATCTSNYVSIIDTSFNNSGSPAASLVLDSSNNARIVDTTGSLLHYTQCTNNACTTSNTTNLDNTAGSTYYYPSIANESDDGLPRIAYETYNGTNYSIKYLQCTNAACTTTAAITSLATGLTSVSGFVSLAMSTVSGNNLHGRVVYVNGTTMMFVKCTNDNCSTSSPSTLATISTNYGNGRMRIGSDGNARIAWSNYQSPYWYLAYTSCSADPCTTTSFSNLTGASNVAPNPSMVLGTDGFPRFALVPSGSSAQFVSYMQCANVACSGPSIVAISSSGYGSAGAMYLGSDGFARILYYYSNPSSASTLEYVICTTASCSTTTTTYNIDGFNYNNPNMNSYSQSAMAIGSDGYPVFAEIYNNSNNGASITNSANFLKISKCLNSTCSYYQYYNVAMPYPAKAYISPTSLKIGSDGFPRLAYSTNGGADVDYLACGDVYCSTNNTTSTVAASGVTQLEVSLALTSGNIARISYMASGLVYAKCNDNACTSPTIKVVDNVNTSTGRYNSLILGTDGFARISYQDATNLDLKFAQCNDDNCSVPVVSTLVSLGSTGYYTSMALGSDGYPRIAYYDGSIGSLMVIKCSSSSCGTYTVTPIAPAGTYPSLLVDSSGYMRISYVNSSGAIALWLEATSGSGFVSLSGLGAAASGNSINNGSFAQSWSWNGLTNQTDPGFAMSADSLTSGNLLKVSTASSGLTGNLVSFSSTGTNNGNVLALSMTGAGSGNILLATGLTGGAFSITSTGENQLSGTARHQKTLALTVEYPGAVLDASGTNNTGTLTAPFDAAQREGYYKWTTATATPAQTYDVVMTVQVPSDWAAWNTTTPVTIDDYTTDLTNGTIVAALTDTAGTLETAWNTASAPTCSLTPASASTWTTKTGCTVAGTYTAGGFLNLRVRMSAMNNSVSRIGTIKLNYFSKY